MPRAIITKFTCGTHHLFDGLWWDDQPLPRCPVCDMESRPAAQKPGPRDGYWEHPILSDAVGVHPSQVAEHRRTHPDIPMTEDGRVVFKNHYERKRILKRLGFRDLDSYC